MKTFTAYINESLTSKLKKLGIEQSTQDYKSEGNFYFTHKDDTWTLHLFYDLTADVQATLDIIYEETVNEENEQKAYIKTYYNIYDYSKTHQIVNMNYLYDDKTNTLMNDANVDTHKQFLIDIDKAKDKFYKVSKTIQQNINNIIATFRQSYREESDLLITQLEEYFQ